MHIVSGEYLKSQEKRCGNSSQKNAVSDHQQIKLRYQNEVFFVIFYDVHLSNLLFFSALCVAHDKLRTRQETFLNGGLI